jgi:hypothetical protein
MSKSSTGRVQPLQEPHIHPRMQGESQHTKYISTVTQQSPVRLIDIKLQPLAAGQAAALAAVCRHPLLLAASAVKLLLSCRPCSLLQSNAG